MFNEFISQWESLSPSDSAVAGVKAAAAVVLEASLKRGSSEEELQTIRESYQEAMASFLDSIRAIISSYIKADRDNDTDTKEGMTARYMRIDSQSNKTELLRYFLSRE